MQVRRWTLALGSLALLAFPAAAQEATPAAESPAAPVQVDLIGRRVLDLDGTLHVLGGRSGDRPLALVFLGVECPISNRAVPQLNRLAEDARAQGVDLFGIVSDRFASFQDARAHRDEYSIAFPVIFDGSGLLAGVLQPSHVPEAYLVDPAGALRYRGALDDGWAAVGKPKAHTKAHYLREAIAALAAGEAVAVPRSQPVGCLFEGAPPVGRTPTYTRDVAPLLAAHCVECHRPGEVAPFALTDYAQAARRARFLAELAHERLMPPWQLDPGWGEFLDSRRLRDEEIAILRDWAAAGAPEGEPADAPAVPTYAAGWRLGEPDLVLEMDEAFAVPAEGEDVFRCFIIPTGFTEDEQVVAFEYQPGAPTVVHHSLLFLDNHRRGRQMAEDDTSGPGYASFGGIGFPPNGAIGGWAPGAQPVRLPQGVARHVKRGADIIMQVHYHPSGKIEKDRGRVALYLAKEKTNKRLQGIILGTNAIDIPAGEPDYRREAQLHLPCDVTVIGIAPHMHYLGREMKVWAKLPDGSERKLIWMPEWDFNWQGQYFYRQSFVLPAGTIVEMRARYDNSADNVSNPSDPPRRVTHGEQTTDEMCLCFLTVTTERPEDTAALRLAMYRMFVANELRLRAQREAEAKEKAARERAEESPSAAEPAGEAPPDSE